MGLIFFIAMNWLSIGLVISLVKRPGEFRGMLNEWIRHPIKNAFLLAWLSSILIAGWGVLSNGHLSWKVSTPWGHIQSWQLGGIAAFAGLGVLFVVSAFENHQHRRRYDKNNDAK